MTVLSTGGRAQQLAGGLAACGGKCPASLSPTGGTGLATCGGRGLPAASVRAEADASLRGCVRGAWAGACTTAGLLVDHRLPAVPYRQWVLSFPGPMAVRLAYDTKLLAAVSRSFARRVQQLLRRRVQSQHGLARRGDLHAGVVTVVQRFRSDLGLFVHLHCLVTDGCFLDEGHGGSPAF